MTQPGSDRHSPEQSAAPIPATIIPSPNIWNDPDVYEIENGAVDPDRVIEAAMRSVQDWAGARVLDVGCGAGYHLPRFAAAADRVVGIEPHPPLAARAGARAAAARAAAQAGAMAPIGIVQAAAQALPLADGSVDVAHARWAYFFGPGCEPGLAELARVVVPGGVAFVVDNDPTRSTFGRWFSQAYPRYDAAAVRRFWRRRGWQGIDLTIDWRFATRADFAAVLGIEFPPQIVAQILAQDEDATGADYAVTLWWHRF